MAHGRRMRKFSAIFRERTIDFAFWIKLVLAICTLLIIPLAFTYDETIQPVPAGNFYELSISSIMMDYIDLVRLDGSERYLLFSNPLTVAAAIIICIPAIILNRMIRNQKEKESIQKAVAVSFLGTALITIFFANPIPAPEFSWLMQILPSWKTLRFGSLAIISLIVFPLMNREASYRGLQMKHRFLVIALGLAAILVPTVFVASYPDGWRNYSAVSPIYQLWYEFLVRDVPWQTVAQFHTSFESFETRDLLYSLVSGGLNLVFAFSILRYLQGQTSSLRAFLLGMTSIVLPYGYALYQMLIADVAYPFVVVPLPILLLLGTAVLIISEPISRPQSESSGDLMRPEESITIPIAYVLRNKLSSVRRKLSRNSGES